MTRITMTKRTTRNKPSYVWMAAVFSLSLLTCCSSPSNTGPQAARNERQPTPTPPLTQQEVAQELAELAATREVFTLTPATAPQKLNRFAKLEDGVTPELRKISPDRQYLI